MEPTVNHNLSARTALSIVIGLTTFIVSLFVPAQTFPDHPVHLVVAYPAGGSGDIIAKAISDKLAAAVGQPFIVDYRAGASGAVGARSVARATPDGYTLLVGQTTEIVINRTLAKQLGYDPDRDLVPVAFLAAMPLVLIVPASAPYSTVQQLVQASRSSPRGLLFASPGSGTPGHLAGELLKERTNSRMIHAPYEGGSAALDAVLNNRVDFHFQALPTAMSEFAAGKLKILAVSSAKRSPAVPDVPTIAEATGLKGFDVTLWAGVFAPRGTSPVVVARLNQAINSILMEPDLQKSLARSGAEVNPMSTTEFVAFLKSETSNYETLIKDEFCSKLLYGGCGGFEGAVNLIN
jgi:tripartite-type tricarboxylate transporter receptor subunit TctC